MSNNTDESLRKHIEQKFPAASPAQIDQYIEEYRAIAHLMIKLSTDDQD